MNKKVTVFGDDYFYAPEDAKGFMEFWQKKLDLIPKEFIESAAIDIEPVDNYGSPGIEVEIYYYRPETNEEIEERERQENMAMESRLKRDRASYLQLKARLGITD
jgi:hypothetical protein